MAGDMRSSRTGRLAQLGGLASGQAAKHAATRTANLVRSDARAAAALEARNAEMAARLVTVLGSMRGAAMKFGQMISMIDGGLIPEAQREEFQRKLAELHANALDVPWNKMRGHIEAELGKPLLDAFAEFDRKPVAAASIGQVYRARLHDGREVAVKVQYPGIDSAVRADLKNVALFIKVYAKFMHEGLDGKELSKELEERITEELDYELEASNTRTMGRAYRGHPFIAIPEVVAELSTRRVLVTEWLDGRPLSSAYDAPDDERNRIAEILFRFYSGTPARLRLYSGDPHPGNSLILADGRIGFLDFGLVKQVSVEGAAGELETLRSVAAGDVEGLGRILLERGFVTDLDDHDPQELFDTVMYAGRWYLQDQELQFTPDVANRVAGTFASPATRLGAVARKQNLPAEHAFRARAELHLAAILGQLRPRLNLFQVASEWIFDAEPVTELGRQHRLWEQESGHVPS